MKKYQSLIKQAIKAGFELHQGTYKYADGVSGARIDGDILLNTTKGSVFDGEVVEVYEDLTFSIYSQFPNTTVNFTFK